MGIPQFSPQVMQQMRNSAAQSRGYGGPMQPPQQNQFVNNMYGKLPQQPGYGQQALQGLRGAGNYMKDYARPYLRNAAPNISNQNLDAATSYMGGLTSGQLGGYAGGALGGYFGGPMGASMGSYGGSVLGSGLGGAMFGMGDPYSDAKMAGGTSALWGGANMLKNYMMPQGFMGMLGNAWNNWGGEQ